MMQQTYERLAHGLANDFYSNKYSARELLNIVGCNKKILENLVQAWYVSGYTDLIDKLMLERCREFIERCYNLD